MKYLKMAWDFLTKRPIMLVLALAFTAFYLYRLWRREKELRIMNQKWRMSETAYIKDIAVIENTSHEEGAAVEADRAQDAKVHAQVLEQIISEGQDDKQALIDRWKRVFGRRRGTSR